MNFLELLSFLLETAKFEFCILCLGKRYGEIIMTIATNGETVRASEYHLGIVR